MTHSFMETPVGKWKINTASRPYILHHINLVVTPNCEHGYHRQPRIFLSLEDAFNYIHRHDHKLVEQVQGDSTGKSLQGSAGGKEAYLFELPAGNDGQGG